MTTPPAPAEAAIAGIRERVEWHRAHPNCSDSDATLNEDRDTLQRLYDAQQAETAALRAECDGLRKAHDKSLFDTWALVNPCVPMGQPGSYARGEYNGIITALKTVSDNYERARRALSASSEGKGEAT